MNEPTLIDLPSYLDDRGIFVPIHCDRQAELEGRYSLIGEAGADLRNIKRSYIIHNSQKGTVRGVHYHQKEYKYFVIIRGVAKFVTLELTPEKATELSKIASKDAHRHVDPDLEPKSFVLSDRRQQLLIVPPYYANAWRNLSEECTLMALSSSTFEESRSDDIRVSPYLDVFDREFFVEGR